MQKSWMNDRTVESLYPNYEWGRGIFHVRTLKNKECGEPQKTLTIRGLYRGSYMGVLYTRYTNP